MNVQKNQVGTLKVNQVKGRINVFGLSTYFYLRAHDLEKIGEGLAGVGFVIDDDGTEFFHKKQD